MIEALQGVMQLQEPLVSGQIKFHIGVRNMELRVRLFIDEITYCLLRLKNVDAMSNFSSDDNKKDRRD